MKSNKLKEVVNSLSLQEKHRFKNQLTINKHIKTVENLFDIINTHKEKDLSKEFVFKKLYNKPYTKERDYLLRNSYRNLSKKIEDFLIEEQFHKEIHSNLNIHNYYILKSYQHLKLYHLFDIKYNSSLKKAENSSDYLVASSITGLRVNNYIHHLVPNKKDYEKTNQSIDLQVAYLSAFYLNSLHKSDFNHAKINHDIAPNATMDKKIKETQSITHPFEDNYSKYLKLKVHFFQFNHDEKIALALQGITLLKSIKTVTDEINQELFFCETVLAHEYAVLEEYDKAYPIYHSLLTKNDAIESSLKTSLICDYITVLIRTDQYTEALETIDKHKEILENTTPAISLKIAFKKLLLYAFSKDITKLSNHIPSCNTLLDYDKYVCRLLYAIEAYLKNDFDNAHRECINLKNSLRYKAPCFDIRDILNFYLRFFYLIPLAEEKPSHFKNSIIRLHRDIELYNEHALSEYLEYLPYIWLQKEISIYL